MSNLPYPQLPLVLEIKPSKTLPPRQTSLVNSSSSTAVAAMVSSTTPRQSRRNINEGNILNISHQPELNTRVPALFSTGKYVTIMHEHESTRFSMDMNVDTTNSHDLKIADTSRSLIY